MLKFDLFWPVAGLQCRVEDSSLRASVMFDIPAAVAVWVAPVVALGAVIWNKGQAEAGVSPGPGYRYLGPGGTAHPRSPRE